MSRLKAERQRQYVCMLQRTPADLYAESLLRVLLNLAISAAARQHTGSCQAVSGAPGRGVG